MSPPPDSKVVSEVFLLECMGNGSRLHDATLPATVTCSRLGGRLQTRREIQQVVGFRASLRLPDLIHPHILYFRALPQRE